MMISPAEARRIVEENILNLGTEIVDLRHSLNRICSSDIVSSCDVPHFNNSAMDGFAIRWSNSSSFKIIALQQAGEGQRHQVKEGEAVKIFTGAMIPEGADTVVQFELCDYHDDELKIHPEKVKIGANIRLQGSQCKKGDVIVKKGTKLNPGTIALLASCGVHQISVFANPKVGILTTGNELVSTGSDLLPGQIFNSNEPTLISFLNNIHLEPYLISTCTDSKEEVRSKVQEMLGECDVLIITGGVSAGDYDFVREALLESGARELFYKIAQKPGKPMFFARTTTCLAFALPGNPASVISCYTLYVKPALLKMMGNADAFNEAEERIVLSDFTKKAGMANFLKAQKIGDKVELLDGQESFNLMTFATADCFVEVPSEITQVDAGDRLKVYDL
jgi:molybdopterin molybdotransferase